MGSEIEKRLLEFLDEDLSESTIPIYFLNLVRNYVESVQNAPLAYAVKRDDGKYMCPEEGGGFFWTEMPYFTTNEKDAKEQKYYYDDEGVEGEESDVEIVPVRLLPEEVKG